MYLAERRERTIAGTPVLTEARVQHPFTICWPSGVKRTISRGCSFVRLPGNGEHTVVALVDGEELGQARVQVTTLGAEFVQDVAGRCEVQDFPTRGESVTLEWQEARQNFVITGLE